jgi:hypothetical protein
MSTTRSNHHERRVPAALLWGTLIAAAAVSSLACSSGSSGSSDSFLGLRGTVTGPSGVAVVGATVYLVPTTAVSTQEITGAGVLAGSTMGFDEPLEDAVANAGGTFTQALTGTDGSYQIATIPDGVFFLYAEPASGDAEHLPGGSYCRQSVDAAALRASTLDIVLSSSPTAGATYAGMSACLICHAEYATEKTLAHRLGFRVPGVSSPLQDISEHPEIDDGLAFFLDAVDYTGGTPVYHYDFDSSRGFDKFKTSLTDPTGMGGVVHAILWLWKDTGTGEHKITIENVGNRDDPPQERVVKLTYGGAVFKQRYMIEWPQRNGLYPLLQFQTFGDESRWDRTRQVFRDYHLDFYWDSNGTDANPADDLIKDPDITKNISRNCIGCHAGGYEQYVDGVTGETLAHTIQDPMGEYDIDGDGFLNDMNTGCENCHGAGSAHIVSGEARYIVSPEYLSPSRSNQLCGRCHNRQEGADPIGNDHPLNAAGEFAEPGISRGEFLASYVKPTVMGPLQSKYWPDFLHSKSHHQQYPDFVKSSHYRNDEWLLSCSDCHDMHGGTGHEYGLIEDPNAADTPLCMNCHGKEIVNTAQHTLEKLGVAHGASTATCVACHMNKTAKTGSGKYGFLLSVPTGTAADSTETYFENDISSHVFDVPKKTNVGVEGVLPEKAMPIPYTQACATCHDPSLLQHL